MSLKGYPLDQGVYLSTPTPFTNEDGVAADPDTVSLTVGRRGGTPTTYTYAAGEITRTDTGAYEKTITPDAPGTWTWHWKGGFADAPASDEGQFRVLHSPVAE